MPSRHFEKLVTLLRIFACKFQWQYKDELPAATVLFVLTTASSYLVVFFVPSTHLPPSFTRNPWGNMDDTMQWRDLQHVHGQHIKRFTLYTLEQGKCIFSTVWSPNLLALYAENEYFLFLHAFGLLDYSFCRRFRQQLYLQMALSTVEGKITPCIYILCKALETCNSLATVVASCNYFLGLLIFIYVNIEKLAVWKSLSSKAIFTM